MKRILIISQYFYPEAFRINDIAKEWVKRGYRVRVLTGIPNYPGGRFFDGYGLKKKRREIYDGIEIRRIPLMPRGHTPIGLVLNYFSFMWSGLLWTHSREAKRWQPDLIFSFETSPMTQVRIGCRYAKKKGVPHFLYVQDLWPENVITVTGIKNPLIIQPIDRMVDRIYRETDRIFVTSPSFAEAIATRKHPVPREKITYWPQYAEEFYRPAERGSNDLIPDDDHFQIAFTGNIGVAQGLEILPAVAEKLRGEKIRFVIIGDGRRKEALSEEIRRRSVEDAFLFIPRQPAEAIPALLACCDAAFLSFHNDRLWEMTIPAKLQSYMACGMPILAAAGGETARIIKEADCGIAVPCGDAEALVGAIRQYATMGETDRRNLSEHSRAYAVQHFGKKTLMDEMDEWIRDAV